MTFKHSGRSFHCVTFFLGAWFCIFRARGFSDYKKGDSLTIYTYEYFSIPSFFRKLNHRITIHGLKTARLKKYNPQLIKKDIRNLDVQVFWSINFLAVLGGFAIYSNYIKKNNTSNSK